MKFFKVFPILIVMVATQISAQQAIMPLWPKEIPNQKETDEKEVSAFNNDGIIWITDVQVPTIEVYLPNKRIATGQAVVIFPGGGYSGLAYDWEGTDIAKALNAKGIAGIVVKYRLPWSNSITKDKNVVPLQDAQRAIRMVRKNAEDWGIAPNKIGVMGFSAGGHLASTLGTHYNEKVYPRQDEADDLSARPDFLALVYPVITLGEVSTHTGSRKSLVGENPTQAQIDYLSNEKHVNKDTPPTFLIHAADDGAVPVENSILFFRALQEYGIPSALHVYPHGGHGFSLALHDSVLRGWINVFFDWVEHLD